MGVYISNMKMPKSCVKCHWYYELYDEHCTLGKFLLRKYPTDVSEEPYILDTQRHPDCPLEEVDDIAFGIYKAYMDGIEEPKENAISLLPSGELLVDTKYANEAKSVRLMDREGFTKVFEEPKTGHWICPTTRDDIVNKDFFSECSECGGVQMDETDYCPNCGAKMGEETNE